MVPVGGAVVVSGTRCPGLVELVNKLYPGRASVAAHLDLLMTLLHWGAEGWKQVRGRGWSRMDVVWIMCPTNITPGVLCFG